MELDDLKHAYQHAGAEPKNTEAIRNMLNAGSHPVLRRIRIQLIIEISLWSVFLIAFYNIFDGHQKPVAVNALLALTVVLVLIHSILGYKLTAHQVEGTSLTESLMNYGKRISRYGRVAIITRVAAILSLMIYFTSTIEFTTQKMLMLGGMLLIIPVQVFMLRKIWNKRADSIRAAYESVAG